MTCKECREQRTKPVVELEDLGAEVDMINHIDECAECREWEKQNESILDAHVWPLVLHQKNSRAS